MLRVFGFAAGLAVAVVVVVVVAFGTVVVAVGATGVIVVVLLVTGGTTVPGATVEPAVLGLPVPGVADVAGVVAGSVVNGVGTGGTGFDNTPAIISGNPLSEPALRNL